MYEKKVVRLMPMEAETMGILVGGFSIVMIIALTIVITLWFKNKQYKKVYSWIVAHFVLFTFGIVYLLKAINYDIAIQTTTGITIHPMASEEISLRLGIAGVWWALSMSCLLVSIIKFTTLKKKV